MSGDIGRLYYQEHREIDICKNSTYYFNPCSVRVLQGISHWNWFYELTLTDRNMQARFYLKVVLKSWGLDIWVSSTSFQKSNIGWPQQPPTEIGPKIQHDISWFYHFFFLSKHQNKAEFKNLYGSEVLSSDFPGLKTSAASMASTASTASMASMQWPLKPHFIKKITPDDDWIPLATKSPILVFFGGMDHHKTQIFTDICTFSVGGCRGQLILFFWKLVEKTQISAPQDFRTTFK